MMASTRGSHRSRTWTSGSIRAATTAQATAHPIVRLAAVAMSKAMTAAAMAPRMTAMASAPTVTRSVRSGAHGSVR